MRNAKDFINRVVKKMGYTANQFIIGNQEDTDIVLSNGMLFLEGTCIPNSDANNLAQAYNDNEEFKVITCDIDNGVSIIVSSFGDIEQLEGINIQPLGVINTFLNQLIKIESQEAVNEFVEEDKEIVEQVDTEHISLKDYYKLNLPDNKIGRKSDKTLIKELEDAGFSV